MTFEKLWYLINIKLIEKELITKEDVEIIREKTRKSIEKLNIPVPKELID